MRLATHAGRARAAGVNRRALRLGQRVGLNLLPDARIDAVFKKLVREDENTTTWVGSRDGDDLTSDVTVQERDGKMYGLVHYYDGQRQRSFKVGASFCSQTDT